ncbi:MAG TPA: hypothetical protein VKB17_02005 [Thermoleophilaceae bacterium]|nr:hypothetical protein [Thermoleophilaceae bacterium]
MTVVRLISPALRSGLLVSVGSALMVLPLVLGLMPAVLVTGIAVGALQVALGLAGTDSEGRGTLPVSVQAVYDRGLATGLLAVGVLFGVVGDQAALLLFGSAGLSVLLVTLTTRYSVRPL